LNAGTSVFMICASFASCASSVRPVHVRKTVVRRIRFAAHAAPNRSAGYDELSYQIDAQLAKLARHEDRRAGIHQLVREQNVPR